MLVKWGNVRHADQDYKHNLKEWYKTLASMHMKVIGQAGIKPDFCKLKQISGTEIIRSQLKWHLVNSATWIPLIKLQRDLVEPD
jgi:hypothetical protein